MQPDNKTAPAVNDDEAARISRRRTLISFAGLGLAAVSGYGSWRWLMSRGQEDGVPWPIRRVLRLNEKISEEIFRDNSRMDERPAGSAPPGPRLNTHIGVNTSLSAADYRLTLRGISGADNDSVTLTLDDLESLPKIRQTTRLCCIEGWNTWGNWAGARLSDLALKFPPRGAPPYVAMFTPNNGYFVGLDIASAMHPQTLLVYELDGQPLSIEHGYPVRLVIPTKYGIKNIKQVSRIEFTHTRPRDYWAEQGYDWYSGL